MKATETKKLPLGLKLGYGGAEGGVTASQNLVYVFLMIFLTDVAGINPAFAGTVLMVANVVDAIVGPVVGVSSDNLSWKWGRRRPIMLIAAVPFGIFLWLMFTDFQLASGSLVYFIAMVTLFFIFFGMVNVPYNSLGPEMTQDYNERTSLVSFRSGWSLLLSIFSVAAPLIFVDYIVDVYGNERFGWSLVGGIMGAASVLMILLTWRTTRGYELTSESKGEGFKPKDILSAIQKNRTFRYTIGVWTAGIIAYNIAVGNVVYFMTYVMGYDETTSGMIFIGLLVCSLLWVPLIDYVTQKTGKRKAYMIFAGLWALMSAVSGIFITGPAFEWLFLLGAGTGMALGMVMVYQIGWAMIPDVTEVDELVSGQRREGLLFSTTTFIQKLATGVTLQIVGLVLAWAGYVANAVQTPGALFGIRMVAYIGPVLFIIPAMIFAYRLPLTPEKFEKLREVLQLKKENKEYDLTEIQDLM
jgi:GPH family glycoside/pentoside/hexuronide:cation symporter